MLNFCILKKRSINSPGWRDSVGWCVVPELKSCGLYCPLGHIPMLLVWSPLQSLARECSGGNHLILLSCIDVSLISFLSLQKTMKKNVLR